MRRITFEQLKEIKPKVEQEYEESLKLLSELALRRKNETLYLSIFDVELTELYRERYNAYLMVNDRLKSKNKRHNFKNERIWDLVDELEKRNGNGKR